MKRSLLLGAAQGAGILGVIVLGIMIAYAADILTVDKDGTIRLRVSDKGKVTLNTSDAAEGDLRFTPRATDPTAPLAGDLWYNSTDREVKYADGGVTKPLAEMTNAALSLYVDATTGDDNNNGLTSGTAVKTIQKAVNLVPPIVRHAVTINVAAGVYRDQGALVGSNKVNVYVANKIVTAEGSLVFQGGSSLAEAPSYRVTGATVDPTPDRHFSFYVSGVLNVHIRGFQCDYCLTDAIYYNTRAGGNPLNCVCSNNNRNGIRYFWYSSGSPTTCTINTNAGLGVGYTASYGYPSGCTVSGNTNYGIYYEISSYGSPANCTVSSNIAGGILYTSNSWGAPSSCTVNSNGGGGIYFNAGSRGYPQSCTANSNAWCGIAFTEGSSGNASGCLVSSNGTSGWGYGLYYATNCIGAPSNCSSPGGNNTSGGLRAEYGSRVDYTDPMPNSNNRTADAASQIW